MKKFICVFAILMAFCVSLSAAEWVYVDDYTAYLDVENYTTDCGRQFYNDALKDEIILREGLLNKELFLKSFRDDADAYLLCATAIALCEKYGISGLALGSLHFYFIQTNTGKDEIGIVIIRNFKE